MKKSFRALSALAVFLTFVSAPFAFADGKAATDSVAWGVAKSTPASSSSSSSSSSSGGGSATEEGGGSYVYVTENIPGAGCTPKGPSNAVDKRLYRCPVQSGFTTVTGVLGSLIKYATYLTGLVGVLMIVLSGIQYSLSGGGEDAKKAKGRIIQLVSGLVLLFLTGLILNTVAPWVYR